MRFHVRTRRQPVINIVSLIDVLCILVIFFIVSTTFKKREPTVKIDLPESKQAQATTSDQPDIIYVTDKDQVYFNEKLTDLTQLEAELKRQQKNNQDFKVALKASKKASFGLIVQVMDAVKAAGVHQLPAFTEESDPAS
jgi:biopolymer transport protein ExbD